MLLAKKVFDSGRKYVGELEGETPTFCMQLAALFDLYLVRFVAPVENAGMFNTVKLLVFWGRATSELVDSNCHIAAHIPFVRQRLLAQVKYERTRPFCATILRHRLDYSKRTHRGCQILQRLIYLAHCL